MDDVVVLYLLLGLWLLFNKKKMDERRIQEREARLRLATQKRKEKYRQLYRAINDLHEEELRRARRLKRVSYYATNFLFIPHLLDNFYVINTFFVCLCVTAGFVSTTSAKKKTLVWEYDRSSEWWDNVVPTFTDRQWIENFRMSEDTFLFICNRLRSAMARHDTAFRHCVPLTKRVAIALWKLATGSEHRTIAHLFGVSRATVCRCVQDFCAAAETLLAPGYKRIPDESTFSKMAAYNERRWGLPQCVGAIGASHIPIIAPTNYHTDHFNRKGWHSIILQAVVDGRGKFWNVFTGLPGSLDDARVLRLSSLWELASRSNLFPQHTRDTGTESAGYYINGDSAYPIKEWLMKPFQDTVHLTQRQHDFNQKLSKGRVVVEKAFWRLKGRWRCLMKRNKCDINLVKSMVLACCALHNLCEDHGHVCENLLEMPESVVADTSGVVADAEDNSGKEIRDTLMQYIVPC